MRGQLIIITSDHYAVIASDLQLRVKWRSYTFHGQCHRRTWILSQVRWKDPIFNRRYLLPKRYPVVDLHPPPLCPLSPKIEFDVKWHLSFACGIHHPVATLHLYMGRCCLVYQIIATATSPMASPMPMYKSSLIRWSWARPIACRWRWQWI